MKKAFRCTIIPSKWDDSSYKRSKIDDLNNHLKCVWSWYSDHKDITIEFSKDKITIAMDEMYVIPLNTILFIQRRCPQCLKMSKKSSEFLKSFKVIIKW